MQRVYKLTIAIGESFPYLCKRSFSITNTAYTWNPLRYAQNLDLGRQAFRVYAVQTLIEQYPDLTAYEVDDVANGLTHENNISSKLRDLPLLASENGINDILAKIGKLKRKNDDSAVSEILAQVKNTCLSSLSPLDIVSFIKSQHPKFLLKHFCDSANINFYISSKHQDNGVHRAYVFFGKDLICTKTHAVKEEAVYMACLSTIQSKFVEQFDEIQLKDFDEIPLEADIDIGEEHRQRVVNVIKSEGDDFGFTIRGGQQKVIRNKDYVQLNTITPIIIFDVKEGSPAESCGLTVGDVLIGVNDHSLTNKTHEQAVISLEKFLSHEEVSFTVIYNKHELLKYEAEQKILDRQLFKIKEEIKSKKFRKWHESKSKRDPMEYFMETFVEKKIVYARKKGGNKNRLWHQHTGQKRGPR